MNIGLSLPPSYLAGVPSSRAAKLLEETCGAPAAFLAELKLQGVRSVELRRVREGSGAEMVLAAAARVWDAGLSVTVHGYLPENGEGGRFEEIFPPLAAFLEALLKGGQETVMTLHAYRAASGDVASQKRKTIAFVERVLEDLDRRELPLKIALEINRAKGYADPSYTYESLLDLRRELDHPKVGFCWDFGHAYWNVTQGELELSAPKAFVERVIHTHIHDLSATGQTHWPLSTGVVPLGAFIHPLQAARYRGVYNLELSPERFYRHEDVKDAIRESIRRLLREGREPAA